MSGVFDFIVTFTLSGVDDMCTSVATGLEIDPVSNLLSSLFYSSFISSSILEMILMTGESDSHPS